MELANGSFTSDDNTGEETSAVQPAILSRGFQNRLNNLRKGNKRKYNAISGGQEEVVHMTKVHNSEEIALQRAMKRVQKYIACTQPLNIANTPETTTKKPKRGLRPAALSEEDNNGGESENTFVATTIHLLQQVPDCIHCNAKKFQYEPPTFCCANGTIRLASTAAPSELYELFTSTAEEAAQFRKNIRAYNNTFAFTSFGVKLDKEIASSRKGVYTFRAQGQIYHDLPSLIPRADNPCYFQLYFYDTDNELSNRMSKLQQGNLSEEVMGKIKEIMDGNPYAQFFRQLKDHPTFQNLEIHISSNSALDQRVYNTPSVDQVGAIWIDGNNPNIPFERDITVHEHSGNKHRVKHYYGCYDPLQYPLLLPQGQAGWHQRIKKFTNSNSGRSINTVARTNNIIRTFQNASDIFDNEAQGAQRETRGFVSCREYYCYRLQVRREDKSTLLLCGRLLQQFVVDMYIKIETTRLEFVRNEQSNFRREIYQGIVDSVMAGECSGERVGQRVVLPVSFVGGPRDMRRRYMDAMALVQHFGRPDLFITMTCNPEWAEIKQELCEGQLPQDRPDLVTRVFRAKLQDLKEQIIKKEIFGPIAAHVFVVEFQKRGLPHIHLLIVLKQGHKITLADQYDRFISAEIPDKDKYPELNEIVTRHMIHGPCGQNRQTSPCMKDGQCKYHYPRPFSNQSTQANEGYPIYKRRNDGQTVNVRGMTMNNQWVVPYNPYLLMRYNCHLNVEVCSGVKAIKYLYKYIYKGHDRCAVYIESEDGEYIVDEIKSF